AGAPAGGRRERARREVHGPTDDLPGPGRPRRGPREAGPRRGGPRRPRPGRGRSRGDAEEPRAPARGRVHGPIRLPGLRARGAAAAREGGTDRSGGGAAEVGCRRCPPTTAGNLIAPHPDASESRWCGAPSIRGPTALASVLARASAQVMLEATRPGASAA